MLGLQMVELLLVGDFERRHVSFQRHLLQH